MDSPRVQLAKAHFNTVSTALRAALLAIRSGNSHQVSVNMDTYNDGLEKLYQMAIEEKK